MTIPSEHDEQSFSFAISCVKCLKWIALYTMFAVVCVSISGCIIAAIG